MVTPLFCGNKVAAFISALMLSLAGCVTPPGYYRNLPPPKPGVLAFHDTSDPDGRRPALITRRLLASRPIPVERIWIITSNRKDPKTGRQIFTLEDNAGSSRCGNGTPPSDGCIYVGIKLIQGMSDDALAGVLAHELGHLEKGHAPSKKLQQAIGVYQTAPSLCQSTANPTVTLAMCGVGLVTSFVAFNVATETAAYSRDLEREADQSAWERLAVSGYCAGAILKLTFDELSKIVPAGSQADILSSHPAHSERAANADLSCGSIVRFSPKPQFDALKDRNLIAQYQADAELGDVSAYVKLGDMYAAGRGVTRDDQQAVLWYTKAAEADHVRGQNNLGIMYRDGRGVSKDDDQAILWFRKAAEAGSADAQNNLAWMYQSGSGVEKDLQQAVLGYTKAAEAGNLWAQSNMGFLYQTGQGVSQSDTEAFSWYRKAAEGGLAVAQRRLGLMYRDGKGVKQDEVEAVLWLTKSAEAGDQLGWTYLGLMYAEGRGVTKNSLQAVYWYEKAATAGIALAQNNLGVMYLKGNGVAKDYREAVRLFRQAAEAGEPNGQFNLALMYEAGLGGGKDYKEAMKWYKKAADAGHKAARSKIQQLNE